ncbi:MAG: AAA family ATPase [Dehalococcoidia bacterium]
MFMNVNRHPANAVVLAEGTPPDESDIGALMDIAGVQGYDAFHTSRARAFGPVRTQPERTYDPVKRIPDAAGQHIPLFLAQALGNTGKAANEALSHALANFGQAAGLWSALDVRRFGDDGDPFQLIVTIAKAKRNLIDVGYGVSQVLPIIVELITAAPNSTFLIQQPEVHLHPRAQAALASLFARLAKERDIQIIVETHSDHFIDRVRMDVRDGKALSPDEVSLLYFELQKGASKIYPIRFDELGNVLDAPSTYRQFFLKEEMRFLGFPD